MDQALQLVGAALILVALVAAQFKRMETTSRAYIVLNLVGSAILAVLAYVGQQWGFFLLEGVWAIVSVWALVRRTMTER